MKLILLQLKRIGDTVLTTPALAALREAMPDAHIGLCLMEPCAALAPALPGVDEVFVIRRRERNTRLWLRLAFRPHEACLDFTGNDRSAFLSFLSKANRRLTFSWVQKSPFRRLFFNEFIDSSVRETHTVDPYLDLLRPLGIQQRGLAPVLNLPQAHEQAAAQILRDSGLGERFIVLHPGTARPEKYWEPERWAAVADYCQQRLGVQCVLTGTHEAFERRHLMAIHAAAACPIADLSGRLDLLTLAAVIRRATVLVSVDSAPVHFGAAFGTPQVALFGLTNPFHWRPRHEKARVLLAGQPAPLIRFAPSFKRQPMSELSTQAVIGAMESLL